MLLTYEPGLQKHDWAGVKGLASQQTSMTLKAVAALLDLSRGLSQQPQTRQPLGLCALPSQKVL
jgi:hypothetical protein